MIALAAALALTLSPPVSAVGLYDQNGVPYGPGYPFPTASAPPAATPDTAAGDFAATRSNTSGVYKQGQPIGDDAAGDLAATRASNSSVQTNTANTGLYLGAPGSTAAAADTSSANLNALLQRVAQNLTTATAAINTLLKAGQSVTLSSGSVTTAAGSTTAVTSLPSTPAGGNLIGSANAFQGGAANTAGNPFFQANANAPGPTITASVAASANYNTTPLDNGGSVGAYSKVTCYAYGNGGGTATVMVQFNADNGATWFNYSVAAADTGLAANTTKVISFPVLGRYNRMLIANGTTAQSFSVACSLTN